MDYAEKKINVALKILENVERDGRWCKLSGKKILFESKNEFEC